MNTETLNRRDVMRFLAVTMAGTVLLPSVTLASDTKVKRKSVFIPVGVGKKGKMGDNSIVFKLDKSQTLGN